MKIQIKRGLKADLPILSIGEFGLCTDTSELYIGTLSGNKIVDNLNGETNTETDGQYRIQWLTQAEYSELQFNNQLNPTTEYHIVDRPTAYQLELNGAELKLIINGSTVATCDVTPLLNT